jgi:hypothetical protein
MSFFNPTEPPIRAKQEQLDVQDVKGLWKINWEIGDFGKICRFYTRIDQVFLIWGLCTFIIFTIAQFLPVSWTTQAYCWSVLTLVGTLTMVALTHYWSRVEQVTWLVYWWVMLMLVGLGLTNFGIFWGWGTILLNLCPIWLALSALGYWGTAIALRSRAFTWAGGVHLLAIFLLPLVTWQFLTTGLIMGGTLLFFAEVQWDMNSLMESPLLTLEQLAFNREQQRRRQNS